MKTVEQFMEEIKTSDALKKELSEALNKNDKAAVEAFLKDNGCDASLEEAKQFLREKSAEIRKNGELSEAELEQVAGGSETVLITLGVGYAAFMGGATVAMAACSD